jgi:hypothetical protein
LAYWTSLATLCLSVLAPLAQGRQAAAKTDGASSFGIQLLDAPTDRRSDPRALKYIVDHLSPGAVIHRRVLVNNESPALLHVEIYPGAATVDKGRFLFESGRTANELTSWMSTDRSNMDLQPHGKATAEVTIQVPPRASAGERYAVVWASVNSSPNPSANVNQVNRAGVRVYLDIGPGGDPPSDFTIGDIVPARDANGHPSVSVKVNNTGQRALDMTGQLTLSEGPAGARAGPFEVTRGVTLAPGQSGTVTVTLPDDLPDGPWKADVSLASGLVKRTATGNVTFLRPGQAGLFGSLSSGGPSTRTVLAGSAIVAVAMFVGLVLVAYRSRSDRGGSGRHSGGSHNRA